MTMCLHENSLNCEIRDLYYTQETQTIEIMCFGHGVWCVENSNNNNNRTNEMSV